MQANNQLLKQRRKEKKMTQTEVGLAIGVDKAMICLYESGKIKVPVSRFSLYAKALDLPEQALVIFDN